MIVNGKNCPDCAMRNAKWRHRCWWCLRVLTK